MNRFARITVVACASALPWRLRRKLLSALFGYQVSDSSYISRLTLVVPDQLVMHEGARISAFNVVINLHKLEMAQHALLGRRNWVTGHPIRSAKQFTHVLGRNPSLVLGEHASVTRGHILDCTDLISVGAFSTIAGYGSQFITHGIDYETSRQSCQPIHIGKYCLVGSRVIVLGGARLPDKCVVGAGSLLRSSFSDTLTLYAGVPARALKKLSDEASYFCRTKGYVD